MGRLKRWWCERRGHRKADIAVDEREFVVTFCPTCRTIVFQALTDEALAGDNLVGLYRELLADYGLVSD